jgi:hypothetical protein
VKRDKLDPLKIGLRIQDIQTSVQDVDLGPLNAETKNIRLLGMAERLAIHIRGSDVIEDYKKLEYIASQFGIDSLVLPKVLDILEELEWARVSRKGNEIRIEESVPYFSNIYSTAGEYFNTTDHSEIEKTMIILCDYLSLSPFTEQEVKKKIGLNEEVYQIILDIGKSGKFIDHYESSTTKETILYSPIYWVEHPDKLETVYELLKKFGADRVYNAFCKIRNYQGSPLPDELLRVDYNTLPEEMKIVIEAIHRGLILAPAVNSLKGEKKFAFTPYGGIPIEEKVILDKAMCILSCIRYGQHFGSITRVKNPELLLDTLLSPPHRTKKPHTEVRMQYAMLVVRGIGRIFPDRHLKSRYYFELIPTEENKKALHLAKDLLKVGEAIYERGFSQELQQVLFYPGSYEEAMRTRPKMKRPVHISVETQRQILNTIMDVIRGGTFCE